MVFENVGKGYEIYPSVGLRHTGEAIRVNFGHAPFKFAIEDHVLSQRNAVWGKIQETKIDWDLLRGENKPVDNEVKPATVIDPSSGVAVVEGDEAVEDKSPMRNLVMSYLAHHGYVNTVKAFQAQCESRSAVGGTTSESSSGMKEDGMEMDETLSVPLSQSSSSLASASRLETAQDRELLTRVEIVNSVTKGDIDTAITRTQDHFPGVFKREEGLMLFKLRCRKFVELILEASEALKRVNPESSRERGRRDAGQEMYGGADGMDGVGAMDVDDPSPEAQTPASEPTISSASISSTSTSPDAPDTLPSHIHASAHPMRISRSISSSSSTTTNSNNTSTTSPSAIAKNALTTALMYGQTLEADYKGDIRPEVRSHLKRTFGIVAYTDPLAAGGEVAEMAGEGARVRLATELNQAILGTFVSPDLVLWAFTDDTSCGMSFQSRKGNHLTLRLRWLIVRHRRASFNWVC